ncbi:MAG: DUF438 domain-containing protein [Bacteroidetes bacterium]|nr:MAG: DUF438 domain-containing protein [Bacteroidota bacterium]
MNQNYLDVLTNDHLLIEKALLLVEKESKKADKMNVSMVKTLIEFLDAYGDKCHNMKEEKIYFPLLLERGLPPQGPIGVMLQEHQMERDFLDNLSQMIDEIEKSGELNPQFIKLVSGYEELTKSHIWKENDILYPMGKHVISPDDEIYLYDEFTKIENDTSGAGAYERYVVQINTFEKQTGQRVDLLSAISTEIMTNMLDSIPVELSFVDADDRVRYFNKIYEKKIFGRTLSVIGRTVQQCHPQKSVHLVTQIIEEMKAGKRDQASFWINFESMFVHISYYAVRNETGEYQGVVEMVHDVKPYRELEGEKRLLDEN